MANDKNLSRFLAMPAAAIRTVYVMVIRTHDQSRMLHVNVTAGPIGRSIAHQELKTTDTGVRYRFRPGDGDVKTGK